MSFSGNILDNIPVNFVFNFWIMTVEITTRLPPAGRCVNNYQEKDVITQIIIKVIFQKQIRTSTVICFLFSIKFSRIVGHYYACRCPVGFPVRA